MIMTLRRQLAEINTRPARYRHLRRNEASRERQPETTAISSVHLAGLRGSCVLKVTRYPLLLVTH